MYNRGFKVKSSNGESWQEAGGIGTRGRRARACVRERDRERGKEREGGRQGGRKRKEEGGVGSQS